MLSQAFHCSWNSQVLSMRWLPRKQLQVQVEGLSLSPWLMPENRRIRYYRYVLHVSLRLEGIFLRVKYYDLRASREKAYGFQDNAINLHRSNRCPVTVGRVSFAFSSETEIQGNKCRRAYEAMNVWCNTMRFWRSGHCKSALAIANYLL